VTLRAIGVVGSSEEKPTVLWPSENDSGVQRGAKVVLPIKDTAKTRKVAILAADGVDAAAIDAMKKALAAAGALAKVVAPRGGTLSGTRGVKVPWTSACSRWARCFSTRCSCRVGWRA
jgi:hypothetical protein